MKPWFLWSMLAVIGWGIWAILSKSLGDSVTAEQSQALSTLGVIPVLIALAVWKPVLRTEAGRRGSLNAFAAGVLACIGNIAYYHALNLGAKVATVVPLTALYPVITVILALLFLRERLNPFQWFGVLASLGAIYLFNITSSEGIRSRAILYAVIPIILWGIAGLLQKIATRDISGEQATLTFLAAFIPVGGILLWWQPLTSVLTTRTWLLLAGVGFCFSFGNLALLLAFATGGKASVITPLTGLYPLISIPLAMAFLGERISGREGLGVVLALISVIALSWEPASKSWSR